MDQLDYKWRINLVKSRFQYLDLTSEQAEKVHRHEVEKIISSEEYFLPNGKTGTMTYTSSKEF